MKAYSTSIVDCYVIVTEDFSDMRGSFKKLYSRTFFNKIIQGFSVKESYVNRSKKDTIRGMHFQKPPSEHEKIVTCVKGKISDVFLDIRLQSSTYGKYESIELDSEDNKLLFLPKGIAHGFKSLEDHTEVLYMVGSEYNPEDDTGIRYDTFGFDWDCPTPIVSERDLNFKSFYEYNSPFL
jgi:dTDP-4-dehydrorhamnose 3,5-epimerase